MTGATILGSTGTSLVSSPAALGGLFPTFSLLKAQLAADQTSADDAIAVANLPQGTSTGITSGGLPVTALSFRTNQRDGDVVFDNDTSFAAGANSAINNSLFAITTANAKAVGLIPGDAAAVDAVITFNSTVDFDFDPTDGISPGTTDFVGVAAHEIAHALGFVSGVDTVDTLSGSGTIAGAGGAPLSGATVDLNAGSEGIGNLDDFALFSTVDLFRRSNEAFAADPDALDLSTSPNVFFSIDGDLSDGDDIPLESGSFNGTGNQASHFLDNVFGSTSLGILDPTVAAEERLLITENDIRAFDVIGFDRIVIAVPEPNVALGITAFSLLWLPRRRRRP